MVGTVNNDKYIATTAKTYIKSFIKKIERIMNSDLRKYNSPENPLYHPELDESDVFNTCNHSIFRMIIGSLYWTVTLGHYDVQHAVSTLARYTQLLREGHLDATKRILGDLKSHNKRKLVYNTSIPDLSEYKIEQYNWF